MRRRPAGLPPSRCHAKAKSTGKRWERWAVVGSRVCWHHGGARTETRDNGDMRVLEAQLADVYPRRSRAEALADARHVSWVWMLDAHNRAAKAVLAGETPDPNEVAAALHGAKTLGRIGQLEAQMGLDDAVARNLQLKGDLVGAAISAGLDWLAGALDGDTAARVRIGLLQRAHEALVAMEDPDTQLPDAPPPGFKLALVEQLPRELDPAPELTTLADLSDDDLETEILRRLRERGEVA